MLFYSRKYAKCCKLKEGICKKYNTNENCNTNMYRAKLFMCVQIRIQI